MRTQMNWLSMASYGIEWTDKKRQQRVNNPNKSHTVRTTTRNAGDANDPGKMCVINRIQTHTRQRSATQKLCTILRWKASHSLYLYLYLSLSSAA